MERPLLCPEPWLRQGFWAFHKVACHKHLGLGDPEGRRIAGIAPGLTMKVYSRCGFSADATITCRKEVHALALVIER